MSNAKTPFNALGVPCCSQMPDDMCACMDAERVLRFVNAVDGTLSTEQRAWCIDQIKWVGDNTTQPTDAELAAMSAKEMAHATLSAWSDYVQSVS